MNSVKKLFLKKTRLILLILILLGVFVFGIINSGEDYSPNDYEKKLIEYFNEVALNTEYNDNPQKTIKWDKNMIIFIYKEKEQKNQIKVIEQTIHKINKLVKDGFRIELTDKKIKSNAILYLCKRETVAQLDPEFHKLIDEDFAGLTYVEFEWSNYTIHNALIYIDIEEPLEIQKSVILEEITQSIGLLGDSEKYSNSIFYEYQMLDSINNSEYSQIDTDIVRLLYDPKMKPGLNKKQCEKVIKSILKESSDF